MARSDNPPDFLFYSTLDDELYDELSQLQGEEIVHCAVWEDSLAEGLPGNAAPASEDPATEDPASKGATSPNAASDTWDMDVYLGGGVYFELYSVAAYDDPDAAPYRDRDLLEATLRKIVAQGATLAEVAVDEEDALVLVLNQGRKPALYLSVGGWVLEEWDELPV